MTQVVGSIPEFTKDESPVVERVLEEVKEPVVEETPEQTETAELPAEKPDTEQKPVVDTSELEKDKAITGLQEERVKLLKEISELRGTRRELKQEQLQKVEAHLDELKDVNPDDAAIIDRVLRAKGYVTKDEASKMFYQAVQQEELAKFLDKYPEYKPENDLNDVNWSAFNREIAHFKLPNDPHQIREVLERAHRLVPRVPKVQSGQSIPAKVRAVQTASVGSGGTQRSSSHGKLDPEKLAHLRAGGWSEEEIKNIEAKLPK